MRLSKKNIFLFVFLCLLYFLTRLINLTKFPIFCDEAIYIRWAQIMRNVPSLRFLPLSDGKQPLFMWLVIPFLKIFSDPLAAGRFVSVIAGFGSLLGVGIVAFLLFNNKTIAFLAMAFNLIVPFVFFFDRMALVDGLLSMFGLWLLALILLLAKNKRLDLAMIAGIILGLALLTKSPAMFFALMLPLSLVTKKNSVVIKKEDFLLIFYWLIIYLFGFTIYNILRLGPEFHMIAIRNKDYIFSLPEVFKHPFNPFSSNIKSVFGWYWTLLTPPVFILGIVGIFLVLKNKFKIGLFLLLWWLIPLLVQSAIAKVYTARYVLFTVPIFLIFSAVTMEKFWRITKNKAVVVGVLMMIFLFPLHQLFLLINNPQQASLPKKEREGYLEMWTAGYGIKEAADYLKEIAKSQKVLVGTEGYFGTLPNGLEIYMEGIPNTTVIGVGEPISQVPDQLLNGLKDSRVFLLVNDSRLKIKDDHRLKLISKYPKAENQETGQQENLLLFEVLK